MYSFRCAQAQDLNAIIRLLADDPLGATRESTNDDQAECYRNAFQRIEADPNNDVIVAEREGVVVGCLQLTIIPNLSRSGTTRAQIEGVRIAASERGQGLGKQLMDWTITEARQRDAGIIQLTTDKSRADAYRFYESLGFVASHEGMKMVLE
jgi:ribosomal protein S18 acetylase RimI-like enzyme